MTDAPVKEQGCSPAEIRRMHEKSIKQSIRELTALFGENSVRGYLQCTLHTISLTDYSGLKREIYLKELENIEHKRRVRSYD